jgi:hypothetical protein
MLSVARSRVVFPGILVCALILIPASVAMAGTVDIFSNLVNESNSKTGTDVSLSPSAVSPAWAPTGPGFEWVSYADTGCNTFVPLTGACVPGPNNPVAVSGTITGPNAVSPTAIFYKTFTITDSFDSGNLHIWADDTARVWLDPGTITTGDGSGGTMLVEANPLLTTNCSFTPGCLPGMDAVVPLNLAAGTYTLVIDAYQLIDGSPFGVMFSGELSPGGATIPEPASFILLGFGLVGLGTLARRRKRS